MAMNGIVKIIVILLSLMLPTDAFTDYFYRPSTRPRASNPHMSDDPPPRNRYSENLNETFARSLIEPQSTNVRHRANVDDNPIVYPEQKFECVHGLCTNVAGYPADQIKRLLNRNAFTHGYFDSSEEIINLDNRFNTDEMSLCETKVHTVYPEKAMNTMKKEKFIVNVEGHKQGVVFETCADNGKCKFSANFPVEYTSYCKQKFIHKKLMVLGDDNQFVYDMFEVPSCCVCTVSKTK